MLEADVRVSTRTTRAVKAHPHWFGEGDVGRKRHGHFNAGTLGQRTIQIKKDAAGAYILSFRQQVAETVARHPDRCRQTHIEASHGTAFLSRSLH